MNLSLEDMPVLSAAELLAHRRMSGELAEFPPPQAVIFVPQKSLAAYILRRHATRQIRGFLGGFYLLKQTKGLVAISSGFGIGAPVIAGLADEFAALGVKRFALVGTAGGLQPNLKPGSLVISSGAIRGEGVSHHYLPPGRIVTGSIEMAEAISRLLLIKNLAIFRGITWTTDAPFRELRKDVREHQNNGVLAVDMEAAGMLSVAKANGLPALAVFSIADRLAGGRWSMSTDPGPVQGGLILLFESLLQYLAGLAS